MDSNRYQNRNIYKIVDNGYNKCYIGSTIEALSTRMARHRSNYRIYLTGGKASYKVSDIFDEFGVDNCKIELIEEYPCDNKTQLLKREGFHIQNTHCVNKCVEGRTRQEYKDAHKEERRQYDLNNKQKIADQCHQYWVNNKDRLQSWRSEKFVCEICQGCYTREHRALHEKTRKHQNAMRQD